MLTALLLTLTITTSVQEPQAPAATRLKVFLDCNNCFADYLREEITFVDFVRDRSEAGLHVIITSTGTAGGGEEYVLAMIGQQTLAGRDRTLKAVTGIGDPEDIRRRQLVNALRIGLLHYVALEAVPQNLEVEVQQRTPAAGPGAPREDPCRRRE